jgi:hypothetical protein
LQAACKADRNRWHGLHRLAADKTTLALPESKSLWKAFGAHNGERGLGSIAVELCCLFDLVSRAPLRFVYRKGFRRRRLVISLLDPSLYPASELAQLYHMRWDIETFYRDFKHSLRATSWHCHTPMTFQQELLMHMMALCLIRLAMLEASRRKNAPMGEFSFTRALTETRLFLKLIISAGVSLLWASVWEQFVQSCARQRVRAKPDRQFSRDRQEYRRKSRGLQKRRLGRKPRLESPRPKPPDPELLKDCAGRLYLLS